MTNDTQPIIDGTTVHTRPTTYTVTCLPDDPIDGSAWDLTVEYRGRHLWAIKHLSYCLSSTGDWDYEMRPSERDDEWLDQHRFDLDTALKLAATAAPHVVINGLTPAGALAWRASHHDA